MADLLIKNMELPRTVTIYPNGDIDELIDGKYVTIGKAIELPPHGDLIDRDELLTDLADRICVDDMLDGIYQPAIDRINEAKTVLEAST